MSVSPCPPPHSNSKYTCAVFCFCECVQREVIHNTGSATTRALACGELSHFSHTEKKGQPQCHPLTQRNLCKCPFMCVHITWLNPWGETWEMDPEKKQGLQSRKWGWGTENQKQVCHRKSMSSWHEKPKISVQSFKTTAILVQIATSYLWLFRLQSRIQFSRHCQPYFESSATCDQWFLNWTAQIWNISITTESSVGQCLFGERGQQILCKEPDGKYFNLSRSHSLNIYCYSDLLLQYICIHQQSCTSRSTVRTSKTSNTEYTTFYYFDITKIFWLFLLLFHHLKMRKIFSSWDIPKQAMSLSDPWTIVCRLWTEETESQNLSFFF